MEKENHGMTERRRTIVGFDPGTTSAIAVLDLDRNILLMKSMRNAGFDEIVEEVISVGKPTVVACDVSPAPDVVRKLAASFDAYLSVPEMDMEVEEKSRLARPYSPGDNHQRDSLAAALGSAGRLGTLIEKARGKCSEGNCWEESFEKVLKGMQPNLSDRESSATAQEAKPRKNKLPIQLKLKVLERGGRKLREEMESQSALILALREANARLARELYFERQTRVRAIESARRLAAPNLNSRIKNLKCVLGKKEAAMNSIMKKLRELEGKEVMILPAGRDVGGVAFVPAAGNKPERSGDKVVFTENDDGGGGDGRNNGALDIGAAGGKRIDEWALIPKDALSRITKDRLVRIIDGYKKERTGQ